MARMRVVSPPQSVLTSISEPVDIANKKQLKEVGKLLLDMEETLLTHEDPPGVGLAAPQVGVGLRIYLALLDDLKNVVAFINPEFVELSPEVDTSKAAEKALEGCLSLPTFYGPVKRHVWVTVKFLTVDLKKLRKEPLTKDMLQEKVMKLQEFESRIMQHEMDHINGRLFTSRLIEQNAQLYQVENRDGEEVFVPVELK